MVIPVGGIGRIRASRYGVRVATLTIALPETEPSASAPAPATERSARYAQTIVLVLLLAAPALMCLHAAVAADPDIWWHLRTGEIIFQQHGFPRTEVFSRDLAGKPYFAYSWLFETLVYKLYQWFGNMGIVAYSTGMVLAITVAVSQLVRRAQADFTLGALLTYAACFSMGHLYTPRSWLFSVLFFVLELDVLLHVRRTGRARALLFLPLIFALWANLHIEYIYGLAVLGLACLESIVSFIRKRGDVAIPLPAALGTLLASLLATLANPYGWRVYGIVHDYASQGGGHGGLTQVSEMQAIPFRDLPDFCLLGLALAAVFALAWSRKVRIFESGLLLFAIFIAFHEQRDEWLISTVAAAILAAAIPARNKLAEAKLPKFTPLLATIGAACILLAAPRAMRLTPRILDDQVTSMFPVDAVKTIRERGYAGPIFNDYNWGGYLMWTLRQPVSIDGRANFYGNAAIERSIATWSAHKDWATDPDLKSARLVIGPAQSALVQVLRMDTHYQLVYEDKLAVVFLHNR